MSAPVSINIPAFNQDDYCLRVRRAVQLDPAFEEARRNLTDAEMEFPSTSA